MVPVSYVDEAARQTHEHVQSSYPINEASEALEGYAPQRVHHPEARLDRGRNPREPEGGPGEDLCLLGRGRRGKFPASAIPCWDLIRQY